MTEINRTSSATVGADVLAAGEKTVRNREGGKVNFVEDQGTVHINRTDSRIEINDEGSIVFYNRADANDPGQENFRIQDGKIQTRDGQWRELPPVATFYMGNGLKMTVETHTPDGSDKPVSTATITDSELHKAGAFKKKSEDFGVKIGNIGGKGAMEVAGGNGRELDNATPDGEKNAGDRFHVNSVLSKDPALAGKIEMDVGEKQVGAFRKRNVFQDVETGGSFRIGKSPLPGNVSQIQFHDDGKTRSWSGLKVAAAPTPPAPAPAASAAPAAPTAAAPPETPTAA